MSAAACWDAVCRGYEASTRLTLEPFSRRALELAALPDRPRILDVACGPGTLVELVAEDAQRVVAIDFSAAMVETCRRRTAHLAHVRVEQGDGQALDHEEAFDAAFSMFGLMFFPDRAAGFRGLQRAVVPGGVAVVSAWPPVSRSSWMRRGIEALGAAFPDAPSPPPDPEALDSAERLEREMAAAGFEDVRVIEHVHRFKMDRDTFWHAITDGFAPIAHARSQTPDAVWEDADGRGRAWLTRNYDEHEVLELVALLGRGVKPG